MNFEQKVASFWARVDKNGPLPKDNHDLGPCWVWIGGKNDDGYGTFCVSDGGPRQANRGAHRVAFYLANGRWPEPEIDHKCYNPSCVRLDHLREVGHLENMNSRRCSNICKRGHALVEENRKRFACGRSICLACYTAKLDRERAERLARGHKKKGRKPKSQLT